MTAGSPTATVTAVARNRSGQVVPGVTIYFVSSNPAIATVDKNTGVVTRVTSGTVTITGQLTDPAGNSAPNTPTISAGTPTVSGETFTGSAFSDPDAGDTQAAAQWQVTTAADTGYATPVISTGDDAVNLTSYAATGLSASTAYIARVRYKDNHGNYSAWSGNASFTTAVGGSSIAKVASVGVQGNGGTTTTAGITTTGASLIVVAISYSAFGPTPTVSDSNGNTWTALNVSGSINNMHTKLFYCANPTVGTGHTFTINGTGIYGSLAAIAFSGTQATPFDVQNGNENQGTITTVQPGSITPSVQHEVLVTALAHGADGLTKTIDSGFTKEQDVASNAGGTGVYGVALAYLIQGAAAASNPTWTVSAQVNYLSSAIASFKATS